MDPLHDDPKDRMAPPYHPIRAPGQRHRDAPMSRRERVVWAAVWVLLAAAAVLTVLFIALD